MNFKSKGFSFVELVIAVAVFMIYAGGLTVAATDSYLTRLENAKLVKAGLYFEEGWEAVRSMKNNNWANLTNGNHGLSLSGGEWNFSGTSDSYEAYIRVIRVSDIYRNASGEIVISGGELDPDIKQVAIDITWSPLPEKNLSLEAESYLTNYKNSSPWPPVPPEPPSEP